MNNYFHQFSSTLNFDYDFTKHKGSANLGYRSGTTGIVYYHITDFDHLNKEVFNKPIFSIKPDLVYYTEVLGSGLLKAHKDHGISCVANFYFDPNGSITTFYEPKESTTAKLYPGMKSSNIYEIADLDEQCSFQAEPGSSYILNVTKIHSVYTAPGNNPHAKRRFINMQWYNTSFEDVVASLVA